MSVQRGAELMSLLGRGDSLLMDGALGTELERHGLPIEGEGWSALAVRDHADVISRIHGEYLDAGARIHIVNSFALARHVLEPLGLAGEFEAFNRQAVALFEQAALHAGVARDSLWAAGSLSTFAANSDRSLLPPVEVLEVNYRDQASILLDAGVDLFALEMLFDVDVSLAMLRAVADFDLPVIVGFTCEWDRSGEETVVTHSGIRQPRRPLPEVLSGVIDACTNDNLIFAIMHSDADVTDAALRDLRRFWQGPVAIYPNSGQFVDLRMQFDSVCCDDEFERAAQGWLRADVQILGGCCGIGPSHIRRLGGKLTWS